MPPCPVLTPPTLVPSWSQYSNTGASCAKVAIARWWGSQGDGDLFRRNNSILWKRQVHIHTRGPWVVESSANYHMSVSLSRRVSVKGSNRNYFGRSAPDASAITQGPCRCRCGGRMIPPSRWAHAAPLRACARPYGMANAQGVWKWQVPSCARRASITSPAGEIKMSRCAHALEPA